MAQRHGRLDDLLAQLAAQLRVDLYDNVVVPVVQDWFACWDSISVLNQNIRRRLDEAWPIAKRKIESAFLDFEETLKSDLRSSSITGAADLPLREAEAEISSAVTNVLGSIVVVVSGTLLGGGGTALLMSGPVGWVMGAIVGAVAFALGKQRAQDLIESTLRDQRIPPLLKKVAKSKVATELKLNAPKFEDAIYQMLREESRPLYDALAK